MIKKTRPIIAELGYNYEEVCVFCRYNNYSLDNFIKSKGIRKQFDLFQEGKTIERIN